MASNLLILFPSQMSLKTQSLKSLSFPHPQPPHLPFSPSKPFLKHLQISGALSSISSTPPSSREEAILQAKTCLSTTLRKPLNNPLSLPTRKIKRRRQPRYRVEIPVVDDSPDPLIALVSEVFTEMPITRKGAKPTTILILWPNTTLMESAAYRTYDGSTIIHSELGSELPVSADVAVIVVPEASRLEEAKTVAVYLDPRPVVLFNPQWGFEEEKDFNRTLGSFVESFDVVYSFMGLEVRGLLSRRKGAVFKCASNGIEESTTEGWVVMLEEEGKLKEVSRSKRRPSIQEVESLLYNLVAANSPITKSAKFLGELASNVRSKLKL